MIIHDVHEANDYELFIDWLVGDLNDEQAKTHSDVWLSLLVADDDLWGVLSAQRNPYFILVSLAAMAKPIAETRVNDESLSRLCSMHGDERASEREAIVDAAKRVVSSAANIDRFIERSRGHAQALKPVGGAAHPYADAFEWREVPRSLTAAPLVGIYAGGENPGLTVGQEQHGKRTIQIAIKGRRDFTFVRIGLRYNDELEFRIIPCVPNRHHGATGRLTVSATHLRECSNTWHELSPDALSTSDAFREIERSIDTCDKTELAAWVTALGAVKLDDPTQTVIGEALRRRGVMIDALVKKKTNLLAVTLLGELTNDRLRAVARALDGMFAPLAQKLATAGTWKLAAGAACVACATLVVIAAIQKGEASDTTKEAKALWPSDKAGEPLVAAFPPNAAAARTPTQGTPTASPPGHESRDLTVHRSTRGSSSSKRPTMDVEIMHWWEGVAQKARRSAAWLIRQRT